MVFAVYKLLFWIFEGRCQEYIVQLPVHVGSPLAPLHSPFSLQVTVASPFRINPGCASYMTSEPQLVASTGTLHPLILGGGPQSITACI